VDTRTAETLLDLAVEAGPALAGLEARSALERLEARCADLTAALQSFIDQGKIDEAMRLAIALATFWRVTKRLAEGCDALDRCLRTAGGDELLRGRASYEAAMLMFWKGDDHDSTGLHRRAVEIGRQARDPTTVALALCGLARIALRSDVAEARRLCHEALAALEGTADRLGRASAIHVLGVAAQMAGDLHEARRLMRERIALARELGSYAGVSMEASNLSMVERQLGNFEQAEALAREALDIFWKRQDHWALPYGLNSLSAVARDRGQLERAATIIGAAEAMVEAQGAAWPPDERLHYEQTMTTLSEAMSSGDFERARAKGRSMSSSEAVAFALETQPAIL
jgi:tetratricopeptide (TPR) repeat protein